MNQSFNALKCHFGRLIKMAALMAKIKQKIKLTIGGNHLKPLNLIKLNNKYTYWYYLGHREYI